MDNYEENKIERAKQVFNATQWEGDARVNFITCYKAGRDLARYVKKLERELELHRGES